MLKRIIRYFDELFFPTICPFCEKIMDSGKGLVCKNCIQVLPFVGEAYCSKCGKKTGHNKFLCEDCIDRQHLFDKGRSVFCYEGMVAESLINFKYHGRKIYADTYAMWIERCLGPWIRSIGVDIIIPVPIHKKRLRKRTYNQAELIGRNLGRRMNIPFRGSSVMRRKNTSPQKKLSAMERMKNMQNAFVITKNDFDGKNILIVDDIYTTGVTMDALCHELKKAGALKISFATVSSGTVS